MTEPRENCVRCSDGSCPDCRAAEESSIVASEAATPGPCYASIPFDEFVALLDLLMCSDPYPCEGQADVVYLANSYAKEYGYPDWIGAFHDLRNRGLDTNLPQLYADVYAAGELIEREKVEALVETIKLAHYKLEHHSASYEAMRILRAALDTLGGDDATQEDS